MWRSHVLGKMNSILSLTRVGSHIPRLISFLLGNQTGIFVCIVKSHLEIA